MQDGIDVIFLVESISNGRYPHTVSLAHFGKIGLDIVRGDFTLGDVLAKIDNEEV